MDRTTAPTLPGDSLPQSLYASHATRPSPASAGPLGYALLFAFLLLWWLMNACGLGAQQPNHAAATQHFVNQRQAPANSPAAALERARAQHLQLLQQRAALPNATTANLTAAWQPLGPNAIVSTTFGALTGRITALAADPNDTTGNTLYVGTTGGGVWKSTNAASPNPAFVPLTDTLPVFASGTSTIASLSIGALAVQPAPNPVLLAGTGDPNSATDSLYGEGILRSTDGGLTWSLLNHSHDGVNGDHYFLGLSTAAIAFSTASPSVVVAAFTTSPQSNQVAANNAYDYAGLYVSTDAGLNWKIASLYDGAAQLLQPSGANTIQDAIAATSVVWNPIRRAFFAAIRNHGYYSSTDGLTWQRLTSQPGANLTLARCPTLNGTSCPMYRGTLTVQPVTGDLYALTVDANSLDQGLWQDLCKASTTTCASATPAFTRIDNAALEVGSGSTAIPQGTYNLTLSAAPAASNGTLLFAGTVDLYRCSMSLGATSCALRNTTNALNGCNAPAGVAPAQHALASIARASGTPLLYLGNDGGLWRSSDAVAQTGPACGTTDASHFTNLNAAFTGSLAEVTSFAQHPTDPSTLLAGIGANGSALTFAAASTMQWPQISSGEGGTPLLDPNTPTSLYAAIGSGINLKQCTLGSACTATNFIPPATVGLSQVANDLALLDAPTLLDPALTTNLLAGTCRVWRGPAASGTTWSTSNALSPAFDGNTTPCTTSSSFIRSLAAGGPGTTSTNAQLSGSQVIYAGIAGSNDGGNARAGHLYVTKNANVAPATWTDTALPNASRFDVSSIAVDPHDTTGATVYATLMGFSPTGNLYRSTDFGAHWTNVSSNLPQAPANDVLIDPGDANILYVALDTGVYVTQSITTCATTNCWSVLGTALPNSPVTSLSAAPAMPTGDNRIGLLRASTYGRGLWQTPLLTATSTPQAAVTLTPTGLTFGPQQVGTQSAPQTIAVFSTGTAAFVPGTPTLTGDFNLSSNTCNGALGINAQCRLGIAFAPTAVGTRTGLLTVYGNIPGGQVTAAISGVGTPTAIMLSPALLTFPTTLVNQTSAAQTLTIANAGTATLTLQAPTISGDFAIAANTCTATLAVASSCTVSITFKPTANGTRSGALTLVDTVGTQVAQLSGTGTGALPANIVLTPNALTFAATTVNQTSAAQIINIANTGGTTATLQAPIITGDFNISANTCTTTLTANSACAVSITFTPTASGARSGTLSIAGSVATQTAQLSGTGNAPATDTLSATALTFAQQQITTTSPAQQITLTNNGDNALTLITASIPPSDFAVTNACGNSLAAHSTCAFSVTFTPTTTGTRTATLTITDQFRTQTVSLTGTGTAPPGVSITPSTLTFPATGVGLTSPAQTLTLTNNGGQTLSTPTLSTTSGFTLAATTCTSTLAVNAACTVTLVFTPTAAGVVTGALTIRDNAPTSPQTATLSATGIDFTLSATGATTATLASGATATYPMLASSLSGLSGTIALACTGTPTNTLCTLNPSTAALGSPTPFTVTVQTGVHAQLAPPRLRTSLIAYALVLPFALLLKRRRRLPPLCLLVCLLTLAGCGPGRVNPVIIPAGANTNPTPTGTYNLTITATSTGLTHTANLTLIVQ